MSGRKASEVSSLLNRANKARNVFDENLDNELEKFSKTGIKNLLKKNDKKLIKVIREYVFSKIKNNDNISMNNVIEAYFEWESEKVETSK